MKKLVAFFVVCVLIFIFSGCNKNITSLSSEISESEENSFRVNTSEQNSPDVGYENSFVQDTVANSQENLSQQQETKNVIDTDSLTLYLEDSTMSEYVADMESNLTKKSYTVGAEEVKKSNVPDKSFEFMGKQYSLKYYNSFKYPHSRKNRDNYVDSDGNEFSFNVTDEKLKSLICYTTPISIYEEKVEPSVEIAKEYLKLIDPDFTYDIVTEDSHLGKTCFFFYKTIQGLRSPDSYYLQLNSNGSLDFMMGNQDITDSLDIPEIDIDALSEKLSLAVKNFYKDDLQSFEIDDIYFSIEGDGILCLQYSIDAQVMFNDHPMPQGLWLFYELGSIDDFKKH